MQQPNKQNPFVTVRFSAVDEYIDELKKNPDYVEPVLRITKVFRQSETLPLRSVSVVAGIVRDTPPILQLIKFEYPCGDILGNHKDSMSDSTMQRAEQIQKTIEDAAAELDLVVRAGLYE
jgi:hypothetical protein